MGIFFISSMDIHTHSSCHLPSGMLSPVGAEIFPLVPISLLIYLLNHSWLFFFFWSLLKHVQISLNQKNKNNRKTYLLLCCVSSLDFNRTSHWSLWHQLLIYFTVSLFSIYQLNAPQLSALILFLWKCKESSTVHDAN